MRLRILSCLLLLAITFDAAASDLYTAINRLRAGEGNCAVAEKLPPLKPQAALERVARDLSRGDKLEQSLKEAGYQASRASAFSIKGNSAGAHAAGMLAKQGSCQRVAECRDDRGRHLPGRAPGLDRDGGAVCAVGGASEQAAGQRVLDLVNQARATPRYCGNTAFNAARPVRWNDSLAEASRLHAEDMARYNYFSHSGRDGSKSRDRIKRTGYKSRDSGENIAAGQRNAEEAMAVWIGSEGHCANLMDPAFTEMGAAVAVNSRSEMGRYWAQEFGTPR